MRSAPLVLLLGLALALCACGKQGSAGRSPAPSPASSSGAAAPPLTAAAQQKTAEQASDLPSKITRMNEDGSETVEDVPSDSGAHNPLLAAVAATVAAASSAASAAPLSGPTLWQEGVNYTRLVPAQPTAVPAGQVEVLEFFWYACPHCYAIDSLIESWKKSLPAYVSFSRVHETWNEGDRSLARLYVTLDALGKLNQLHSEVFKEIHVHGNPLVAADPNNTTETEHIQMVFARKFGISENDFTKAYHSLPIETALQRSASLVQRYRITGVPTFVVNGKFLADVASAGGPDHPADGAERLLTLVGDLAAQEHKR
jgi:protein dithiol oxidoreductase (disulfide-forming)